MAKTSVHISAPHQFHVENKLAKGQLKKRAMRCLAAKCRDEAFTSLEEVSDPSLATACFRILMTNGQWKIGKVRI